MKTLIKVALLLVVGILTYNYFFGTADEKASTERVIQQVKEVGKSVGELVKVERQKFADGKYDKAFDKIENMYNKAKAKLANSSEEEKQELQRLEERREKLEREKETLERTMSDDSANEKTVEESKTLEKELDELLEESKLFLEKVLKE